MQSRRRLVLAVPRRIPRERLGRVDGHGRHSCGPGRTPQGRCGSLSLDKRKTALVSPCRGGLGPCSATHMPGMAWLSCHAVKFHPVVSVRSTIAWSGSRGRYARMTRERCAASGSPALRRAAGAGAGAGACALFVKCHWCYGTCARSCIPVHGSNHQMLIGAWHVSVNVGGVALRQLCAFGSIGV